MTHLDGNVLAGALSEVFDGDMTSATGRCRGCGDEAAIARAMVYSDARGYVVRCNSCGDVLMTIAQLPEGPVVTLRALGALRLAS
jgi:hypothetical protein